MCREPRTSCLSMRPVAASGAAGERCACALVLGARARAAQISRRANMQAGRVAGGRCMRIQGADESTIVDLHPAGAKTRGSSLPQRHRLKRRGGGRQCQDKGHPGGCTAVLLRRSNAYSPICGASRGKLPADRKQSGGKPPAPTQHHAYTRAASDGQLRGFGSSADGERAAAVRGSSASHVLFLFYTSHGPESRQKKNKDGN